MAVDGEEEGGEEEGHPCIFWRDRVTFPPLPA